VLNPLLAKSIVVYLECAEVQRGTGRRTSLTCGNALDRSSRADFFSMLLKKPAT